MKISNCDIIKDLLPNYIDKVSSDATNKLIEEHLQICESCNKTLRDMSKEINTEPLYTQNEQIDYLKGYKKKNIGNIIATIIITILVVVIVVLWGNEIMGNLRFNIDLNNLSIDGWYLDEEGKLGFYLWEDKKNIVILYNVIEDKENKEVYINVCGKYLFSPTVQQWNTENARDINKVYVRNKEGDTKLIWDKDQGLLVKDISNYVHASNKKQK